MVLPPKGADGQRITINSNLDENGALWQLRSGWNVAALNCLDPSYQPVLDGYAAFLKKYRKQLTTTNTALARRISTSCRVSVMLAGAFRQREGGGRLLYFYA